MQHRRTARPAHFLRLRLALTCAAVLLSASCGGDGGGGTEPPPPPQRTPTSLRVSASAVQVDDADTTRLAVTVLDQNGQAFASIPQGVSLSWTSADAGVAGVDDAGLVTGNHPGETWVRVRSGSMADSSRVTVRQVAAALQAASGGGQTGAAGDPLPEAMVARVVDRHGDGVSGVSVAFAVTAGGGSVSPASATTDASGEARATWVLGTAVGENRAEASAAGLTGSAATFTANGVAGAASAMFRLDGDAQTGTVGAALPQPARVRVRDRHGNAVAGATVTFGVVTGGGSVAPGIATTDAQGVASTTWTLGPAAGAQTLSAAGAGTTLSFSATALAGAASTLERTGGDGQTATAGQALPTPVSVRVEDAMGNPVPGVTVAFRVTGGGGSVSPASATTDASGAASATWTLGPTAGAQALQVASTGKTVSFSATALAGAASVLERTGGDGQTGTVGQKLPAPLSVRVKDAMGNPVSGVTVTFRVTGGGGSVSPASAATNASGVASASWTLGTAPGAQQAQAAAAGKAVAFSATATAGAPASVVVSPASALLREGETVQLSAAVEDAYGNSLPGAAVSWTTSRSSVATVDGTGRVTAVGEGSATVTATSGSASGTAAVTVLERVDTQAPTLTGFTFSPSSVDVGSAARTVDVRLTATDAGSGVAEWIVTLRSPGGSTTLTTRTCSRVSGTATSGTWSCSLTIPRNAGAGTWVFREVFVEDAAGNAAAYSEATLAASYQTELQVSSGSTDTAAPAVSGVTLSPTAVDVTTAARSVTASASVSDAGSGVSLVQFSLWSPARQASASAGQAKSCSATGSSGTWSCTITVPQGAEAGTWALRVLAVDALGNSKTYTSADLALPTLSVTSGGVDATAPTLTAFSFSPASVDVSGGSASVTVTVGASDAVAGVENVAVSFESPGQSPYVKKQVNCVATAPASGTRASGTWRCTLTVPAFSEPGSWRVLGVELLDRIGNRRTLDAAGVQATVPGASTTLTVAND